MKTFFKILLYTLLSIVGILAIGFLYYHIYFSVAKSRATSRLVEKPVLEEDGYKFRDLNNNGKLDIYDDRRKDIETRVEDVLSQMIIEEKVGLMWHPPIGLGENGEILGKASPSAFFFGSTYDYLINKKLRTFNLFAVPRARALAQWYNDLQKLAEQDRFENRL